MLEIHKPGTEVNIGPSEERVTGYIVDVLISTGDYVQYKVAWWDKRTRCTMYFEEFEVTPVTTETTKIGFRA